DPPVVAFGDDQVAGGHGVPAARDEFGPGDPAGGGQPVGAAAGVELADLLQGGRHHDRVVSGGPVRDPGGVDGVDRGVVGDGVQPPVVGVVAGRGGVPAAQREGRLPFDRVGEPHHLDQGRTAVGGLDVAEHTPGACSGAVPVAT